MQLTCGEKGEAQQPVAKRRGRGRVRVKGCIMARDISDFEDSDNEVPELFGDPPFVDAEEVRATVEKGREKAQGKQPVVEEETEVHVQAGAEKRKSAMEWFGTGSACGADVGDPHSDEASESMSEG
ncbi:hypothetical protein CJ030_MR3G020099 [Morella rubra]|uniref:Uncharacterized protein n=1 Tax=Morella rubra TaxID=262757 RepID=A0A6A1W442_9ROSI|nr:hypothetical protein CJ030_MR3G020099 [Morella rubra]